MATKKEIRNVNININGKEVRNDIKSIGGEYKKAKNELAKLTIGSDQYNKKLKEVKKLKGVLDDHRKQLGLMKKTWGSVLDVIKRFGPIAIIIGTVVKAVRFLTNSTKEYNEISAKAAKLTGLHGKELEKVTNKVIKLSKAYKEDYNKILISANTFSKEMGISQSKALDLIETGFQKGANASGEFMDILREYPTFLKNAGLSAEESIAVITQQVSEGIYSDKGVDAIKEATIRLREMTPVTREALDNIGISSKELEKQLREGTITYFDAIQMVSDKLGEFPEQSTEVGQALADIFGGAGEDAGIRYIKMLGEMDLNLDNVEDKVTAFKRAKVSLSNTLRENLNPALNKAAGFMGKFLGKISDYVEVPVSRKLQQEQVELNTLVARITDTNIQQTERNKLIKQLQEDYPGFLKNLNTEKVTNEELTQRLKDVNAEYVNRIIIQTQKEKIEEKAKKVGELTNEKLERELDVTQKLNELNIKHRLGLDLTNKTYSERYNLVADALKQDAKYLERTDEFGTTLKRARNDEAKALNKLDSASAKVGRTNRLLIEAQKELNEVTQRGNDILKEAGLQMGADTSSPVGGEAATPVIGGGVSAAAKKAADEAEKLRKKAEAAEAKLQAKIKEIREQLHLSTLTEQAKEIQAVQNKYAKLLEEAKGNADAIKQLEELKAQEITAINKKYEDEKVAKRAEVEQKIQEMLLQGKDKEIYLIAKKYQDLIKMAEEFGFDTSELFAQMQEQIAEIEEKYSEDDEGWLQKILGLTDEEWEKLEEKFEILADYIDQAAAAYSAYANLRRAQDDAEMQNLTKNADIKKATLKKQLDSGIISQEVYAAKVKKIDDDIDSKKADMMKEQSERQKNAAIFSAAISTFAAIIGFMADPSGWAGVGLSLLAAITGGLQIAAIKAEPVPAYKYGGYKDKEGLALLAEGNKKEGVLSNKMLTDPTYGPMANYLMDVQAGKPAVFPTNSTEVPDRGSISQAMDYNSFQRSGGQFSQPVNNTYNTTTTEQQQQNMDNTQMANDIRELKEFLSDPRNRQATINYDLKKESDEEMEYLNRINKF